MSTVLTDHQVRDPRTLAALLTERNLPGRRSATAITRLRRARARLHPPAPRTLTVAERLRRHLTDTYTAEVARRGGETSIAEGEKASALTHKPLAIADRREGLVLLRVEGWRFYSRGYRPERAALAYLCGKDDSGPWAARVPGKTDTVADALAWLTPAAVLKARAAGRRVLRQGDVYALETTPAHDTPTGYVGDDYRREGGRTFTSHHWNAATRYLTHHPADGRKHRPLRIGFPVRFVQQSTLAMGRNNGWGAGD